MLIVMCVKTGESRINLYYYYHHYYYFCLNWTVEAHFSYIFTKSDKKTWSNSATESGMKQRWSELTNEFVRIGHSPKRPRLTSRGLQQIRNNHWNHIHVFCYQKILFDTLLAYENSAIIGLNKNNIKINWPHSWSSCRTRLSWFVWYDCVCKHK